jgi:GTP-binding protein
MTYVSIIGRPNVGKSTLFNRLVGKKLALVDDQPGVTRDRRESKGHIADLEFTLCDTAGVEEGGENPLNLQEAILAQTNQALKTADLIFFVIDGREGVTPTDKSLSRWLHKSGKSVILLVNKCEGKGPFPGISEGYSLGFSNPIPLSAEHGEGIDTLYERVRELAPSCSTLLEEEESVFVKPLKLTIIGRPNGGKSTLINHLLSEERLLTGPEAGVTRDAITVSWSYEGKKIDLVDTAGIRRRSRVVDPLEKAAVQDALRALKYAEVAVLVLDAQCPLEHQDLILAARVIEEGRGLVIALNKWDLIGRKEGETLLKDLEIRLAHTLGQARGALLVPISAQTGFHIPLLMKTIFKIYERWNKRVPTAKLNQWLEYTLQKHSPPLTNQGRPVRLKYITQIKSRPPTFTIFANKPGDLPESYKRYLENNLRESFDLGGIPLRLFFRHGKAQTFSS